MPYNPRLACRDLHHISFTPHMPTNAFHLLRRAELDDDGSVVFWTDIFIVLMLAIFTIATIPHAIGLFRARYDWKMGHLLCKLIFQCLALTYRHSDSRIQSVPAESQRMINLQPPVVQPVQPSALLVKRQLPPTFFPTYDPSPHASIRSRLFLGRQS